VHTGESVTSGSAPHGPGFMLAMLLPSPRRQALEESTGYLWRVNRLIQAAHEPKRIFILGCEVGGAHRRWLADPKYSSTLSD
jgi:hypothetical protein